MSTPDHSESNAFKASEFNAYVDEGPSGTESAIAELKRLLDDLNTEYEEKEE